jgi:hypothetical protein
MPDVLHFRGFLDDFDPDHLIGPDFGGRWLRISHVEYDTGTDISTAVLRGVLPDDYRERVKPLVANQRERERIRKLFNG